MRTPVTALPDAVCEELDLLQQVQQGALRDQADEADLVENAVNNTLQSKRTGDIMASGCEQTGTDGMTKGVLDEMDRLAR